MRSEIGSSDVSQCSFSDLFLREVVRIENEGEIMMEGEEAAGDGEHTMDGSVACGVERHG